MLWWGVQAVKFIGCISKSKPGLIEGLAVLVFVFNYLNYPQQFAAASLKELPHTVHSPSFLKNRAC